VPVTAGGGGELILTFRVLGLAVWGRERTPKAIRKTRGNYKIVLCIEKKGNDFLINLLETLQLVEGTLRIIFHARMKLKSKRKYG
jgi:hypothetical protein